MVSTLTRFAAVALVASGANAAGSLGFNLGVENSDGSCKGTSDYEADFDALKGYSDTVKTYATSDCNTLENIYPALASKNMKIFMGVWPNDDAKFLTEQEALKTYLPKMSVSNVRGILVGSESMYRKEQTGSSLANCIKTVKSLVAGLTDKDGKSWSSVPVGTVDSWNMWVDGGSAPAIAASDIVMANAFSYWQGQGISTNATYSFFDDIMQALQTVQTAKGSNNVEFWVGETGWPTEGSNYQNAVPGLDNAKSFWQNAICAIRSWGINTLVFEAFDEPWKPTTKADDGTSVSDTERHWGVFNVDRSAKYDLTCSYLK